MKTETKAKLIEFHRRSADARYHISEIPRCHNNTHARRRLELWLGYAARHPEFAFLTKQITEELKLLIHQQAGQTISWIPEGLSRDDYDERVAEIEHRYRTLREMLD